MIDVRLLRHLWSFLAVAEEGNFGRAAKRLGISQPPLTKQIQILETSLGVILFERSRHGAALTREGRAILPAVRRFAEQMGEVEAVIRSAKDGEAELITIGAITSSFYDVLPRILAAVATELPGALISFKEIHTADAVPLLQSGAIDIAFSRIIRATGTIQVAPIVTGQLVVALPSRHPLASQGTVALMDLAEEPWVHVRRDFSPDYFDRIISAATRAGFSPRLVHEVRSEASQIAFVSCGLGIALVHAGMMRSEAPNVVFRSLSAPVEMVTVSVASDLSRSTTTVAAVVEIARRLSYDQP